MLKVKKLNSDILNVNMLCVNMLNVDILSADMLNIDILNVEMLNIDILKLSKFETYKPYRTDWLQSHLSLVEVKSDGRTCF